MSASTYIYAVDDLIARQEYDVGREEVSGGRSRYFLLPEGLCRALDAASVKNLSPVLAPSEAKAKIDEVAVDWGASGVTAPNAAGLLEHAVRQTPSYDIRRGSQGLARRSKGRPVLDAVMSDPALRDWLAASPSHADEVVRAVSDRQPPSGVAQRTPADVADVLLFMGFPCTRDIRWNTGYRYGVVAEHVPPLVLLASGESPELVSELILAKSDRSGFGHNGHPDVALAVAQVYAEVPSHHKALLLASPRVLVYALSGRDRSAGIGRYALYWQEGGWESIRSLRAPASWWLAKGENGWSPIDAWCSDLMNPNYFGFDQHMGAAPAIAHVAESLGIMDAARDAAAHGDPSYATVIEGVCLMLGDGSKLDAPDNITEFRDRWLDASQRLGSRDVATQLFADYMEHLTASLGSDQVAQTLFPELLRAAPDSPLLTVGMLSRIREFACDAQGVGIRQKSPSSKFMSWLADGAKGMPVEEAIELVRPLLSYHGILRTRFKGVRAPEAFVGLLRELPPETRLRYLNEPDFAVIAAAPAPSLLLAETVAELGAGKRLQVSFRRLGRRSQ